MTILKALENRNYKLAYECGLILSGIEGGKPLWLGTVEQLNNYWKQLKQNNL